MLWIVDISAPAENWKNLTSTLELQVAATSSGLDEYGETMIYCIYIIYIYEYKQIHMFIMFAYLLHNFFRFCLCLGWISQW